MQNLKLNYLGARHNDLTDVMLETISGQALQLFRKKTPILSRINVDVSDGVSAVGDTIKAQLPIDLGLADKFTVDGEESVETPFTEQSAPVTLNNHFYKEFAMSIREFSTSYSQGTVPRAMEAAINAVAKSVNKEVLALTAAVVDTAGGAGSAYGVKSILAAKAALDEKEVEGENRFLGMGAVMANQVLAATISGFDKKDPHYVSGQVGDMLGFSIFEEIGIKSPDGVAPEPNIAYHRSAFTAAFRKLESASGSNATRGALIQDIVDPVSGLPMRLTHFFNPKTNRDHWRIELLMGAAPTRPNSAVIVLQED